MTSCLSMIWACSTKKTSASRDRNGFVSHHRQRAPARSLTHLPRTPVTEKTYCCLVWPELKKLPKSLIIPWCLQFRPSLAIVSYSSFAILRALRNNTDGLRLPRVQCYTIHPGHVIGALASRDRLYQRELFPGSYLTPRLRLVFRVLLWYALGRECFVISPNFTS